MYGVMVDDIDRDGNLDVMMGGNLYRVKPEVGRYDASYGVFLKGDGKGALPPSNQKTPAFLWMEKSGISKKSRSGNPIFYL